MEMTKPLTPREKVENALYSMDDCRLASPEHLIDNILTALASGSGDHAELARLAEWHKDEARKTSAGYPPSDYHKSASRLITSILAEDAALRADLAKTECDYSELRNSYDRVSNKLCVERAHGGRETKRATEAERKLAEAREVIEFYAAPHTWRSSTVYMCGHSGRTMAERDGGKRARTFISKEAERG